MQLFHYTPQCNVTHISKEGLRPMIGPRSQDIGEDEPLVYCFTSLEAAEEGLMNWLDEQFDQDETLCLLEIDGTTLQFAIADGLEWEARIREPIPPQLILSYREI